MNFNNPAYRIAFGATAGKWRGCGFGIGVTTDDYWRNAVGRRIDIHIEVLRWDFTFWIGLRFGDQSKTPPEEL